MREPLHCLTGVVGVADTDCECFEGGRPEDYNEATSGLYLHQLVDMDVLAQAYNCPSRTVWQAGQAAIDEATLSFQANISHCWAGKHKPREKWSGLIGQRDCPRPVNLSAGVAGLAIVPNAAVVDGEMVITSIGTLFTHTGTITVRVYDQLADTFIYEVNLDTTANTFQGNVLGSPIVLPFTASDGVSARYWLLYDATGIKPKEGECNCGCSSRHHRMREWANVYGVRGNGAENRREFSLESIHMGLLPTATFQCNTEAGICKEELDFATDPHAAVMAEAIWYLAASLVHGKIRRTVRAVPAAFVSQEEIEADRQKFAAEYSARVKSLCDTMQPGSCYECKPKMGLKTLRF